MRALSMTKLRTITFSLLLGVLSLLAIPAMADQPHEWGLNLQEAASTSAARIGSFHDFMIWVCVIISVFVMLLLFWVVIRYNKRTNPKPSNVSHNVMIEVIWTVVPVVILIIISIQSLPLLYYTDRSETYDMTLKITGYQWYWGYEYPDNGGINFMSNMIPDAEIKADLGQVRNLSTDNPVVLPVGKNIQLVMTAADVLHAWTIPAFGVKKDSIPGRLNETWVHITKPGIYYGQCSELCGKNHSFMPIEVHAVTEEQFNAWVEASKNGPAPSPLVQTTSLTSNTKTQEE